MNLEKNTAIIVVDVQNDFCPGGSLAVTDGDQVVGPLNQLLDLADQQGWQKILTRDWHPANTTHFAINRNDEQGWPVHCVQETAGAKFHPGLEVADATIITKGVGEHDDAYSGFDGTAPNGQTLEDYLHQYQITRLYIGGLATDYCVRATALDAAARGFRTFLLLDAIKAVNIDPSDEAKAIGEMVLAGVQMTSVQDTIATND